MFIAHRNMVTQEIQRTSSTTFVASDYTFDLDEELVKQMPFFKYAKGGTTILVSGAGPTYTLTTSVPHWGAVHAVNNIQT